ncbi:MAG: ATP-binding cassette domain-containing protein [Oscillospiraceae bacterium]
MNDICLNKVSKAYGEKPVLQNFSAVLPAGGRVALMGPSGQGKTTLARLLMGLEKPDSGSIEGAAGLRFCPVFQEDRLCEGFSALQNVALVLPRTARAGIAAALAATGLLQEDIYKPVRLLSGGQRRRVALVRALEAAGEVVVLDEAFKGLDGAAMQSCFAYVRAALGGRTLLVVTHSAEEAGALCSQTLVL